MPREAREKRRQRRRSLCQREQSSRHEEKEDEFDFPSLLHTFLSQHTHACTRIPAFEACTVVVTAATGSSAHQPFSPSVPLCRGNGTSGHEGRASREQGSLQVNGLMRGVAQSATREGGRGSDCGRDSVSGSDQGFPFRCLSPCVRVCLERLS